MSKVAARIKAKYPTHVLYQIAVPAGARVVARANRSAPINSTGRPVQVTGSVAPIEPNRVAVVIHADRIPDSRWVYGRSRRRHPFINHRELNGLRTDDRQTDPRLAVKGEDVWLGITHYEPQDHDGCRCRWADEVQDGFFDRAIATWPDAIAAVV